MQVQETLHRTAFVASNLEARLGATSAAREQSLVIAERVQIVSEKTMRETQMLQVAQQVTATEIKEKVAQIGIRIQQQSQRIVLQEQTRKEQQDHATEQLS